MTEQEWLDCVEPRPMLEFLRGKSCDRKLRLFACACYRRIWHVLTEKQIAAKTLAFAEQFADGLATIDDLRGHAWGKPGEAYGAVSWNALDAADVSADHSAGLVAKAVQSTDVVADANWDAAFKTAWSNHDLREAMRIADDLAPADWVAKGRTARRKEEEQQSHLLRDIFGNLFRQVMIDRRWRTSTVLGLASIMYEELAFDRMPILADALMDAGCDSEEIISHCRQLGEHARGCWVVDLLLQKT